MNEYDVESPSQDPAPLEHPTITERITSHIVHALPDLATIASAFAVAAAVVPDAKGGIGGGHWYL